MKIIALTGATGLVGSRIIELLGSEFSFVTISQGQMDITNKDQVYANLKDMTFDAFLHLAAYTNVDAAETEKETAYKINVEGTRNVFEVVKELKRPFIQMSTDFVFDGQTAPFSESSTRNPVSEYGKTKAQAEEIVEKEAMIVRLSYPYRAEYDLRPDFVRGIRKRLHEKQPVQGITDSVFTPTFIDDIAFGLKHLFQNYSPEIFHLVGSSSLSPFEACQKIANVFDLDASLISETTYDTFFEGRAKRPKNCQIISSKSLPFAMRTFEDGLLEMKKQLVI